MNFAVLASGLRRPEGVCVDGLGGVWVSDQGGLLCAVGPDGSVVRHGSGGVEPNGLAVDAAGRIVVADYGGGGVLRYDPASGATALLVDASVGVEGVPVLRANHPAIDADGRIWCTNSTNVRDDVDAVLRGCDDGFVFVLDGSGGSGSGARIAAEGLAFPTGLALSRDGRWLYVALSASHCVARAPVLAGGDALGPFQQFGPDLGAVPDGVAVDLDGSVWVTLVFQRQALLVLAPDGSPTTVAEGFAGNPTNVALTPTDVYVTSADAGVLWQLPRTAGAL
jgi:gluconolactonase